MKIYVKKIACKDLNWIKVAEARVLGVTVVNAVFSLRDLPEAKNCFTSCNLRVSNHASYTYNRALCRNLYRSV
jgi:hypothetical protein